MEGDAFQLAFFPRFRRISIHSLRMEGDFVENDEFTIDTHFNPLPPHGGRLLQTVMI